MHIDVYNDFPEAPKNWKVAERQIKKSRSVLFEAMATYYRTGNQADEADLRLFARVYSEKFLSALGMVISGEHDTQILQTRQHSVLEAAQLRSKEEKLRAEFLEDKDGRRRDHQFRYDLVAAQLEYEQQFTNRVDLYPYHGSIANGFMDWLGQDIDQLVRLRQAATLGNLAVQD